MIGTFINIIPYRIKIEVQHSLVDILELISKLSTDIFKHKQFPYQLIMNNNDIINPAKLPFHFKYYSTDPSLTNEIKLKSNTNEATLYLNADQSLLHGNNVVSNNLTLSMIYNHDEQKIQLVFDCSADCYDETATLKISQRFQNFLTHLFTKDTTTNKFDRTIQPIANIFPHMQTDRKSVTEMLQIQSTSSELGKSFHRQLLNIFLK
jgi:hypothetical protein